MIPRATSVLSAVRAMYKSGCTFLGQMMLPGVTVGFIYGASSPLPPACEACGGSGNQPSDTRAETPCSNDEPEGVAGVLTR